VQALLQGLLIEFDDGYLALEGDILEPDARCIIQPLF